MTSLRERVPGRMYFRMLKAIEQAHPALDMSEEDKRDAKLEIGSSYLLTLDLEGVEAAEKMAEGTERFFLHPPEEILADIAADTDDAT